MWDTLHRCLACVVVTVININLLYFFSGTGEGWRRSVGPIVWEMALRRVTEERNILHAIKRMYAIWISRFLRRNCLLQYVTEAKIWERVKAKWRRGRKRKLDDLNKARGQRKLKEDVVDRILWRTGFGRGCEPVVRQAAVSMNERMSGKIIFLRDLNTSFRTCV
jgi:hypothetical protein